MIAKRFLGSTAFLLLATVGCESTAVDPAPRGGPWASEIAWEAGTKIGGCALGDVDPETPGDEIVVVTGDYRVVLLRRTADGWSDELVAELDGEMIQVAVADLSPAYPGEEIVCVGAKKGSEDDPGPGLAIVCFQSNGLFLNVPLFEDEALIHGVSIDDSGRIVTAGYSGTARFFETGVDLTVLPEVQGFSALGTDLGQVKAVLADGPATVSKVVAANAEGRLVSTDGVAVEEWWRSSDSLARLGRAGDLVLCCDNGGRLVLFSATGAFPPRQIHDSADRLRGAVLADLSLDHEGVEAATAGYDGRVLVFDNLEADAPYTVVATDNDRFHHLASGVVEGLGPSLVAVGYGGRVHVAYRKHAE